MREYKELIELLAHPADGRDNADIMISAADAIEQLGKDNAVLTKERDAAVHDLKTYGRVCRICRELDSCYSKCPRMNPKCGTIYNECWEWRGVQEEENGTEI